MCCCCSSLGSGRSTTMLSIVARTSFMSWRLAPSAVRPIGTPCPSVNKLRLTPDLARSVGLGPLFFPAQRGFGHRPVHTYPFPINPLQLVEALDPCLPQLQEHTGFLPLLKPVVRR